jgi:flagellar biosynthesis/type III secretory pathway protein FliH
MKAPAWLAMGQGPSPIRAVPWLLPRAERRPAPEDAAPPPVAEAPPPPPDPLVEELRHARAATARIEGEIAALRDELAAACRALEASREEARAVGAKLAAGHADVARTVVELAVAIARRAVGRELDADASLVARWAREAIAESELGHDVTIVSSPDLAAAPWEELAERVVVDPSLGSGSCELRTATNVVGIGPRDRVDAIFDHLKVSA